jgi:1-acyl-sn-glycerol-3-phosphate acyltransferase
MRGFIRTALFFVLLLLPLLVSAMAGLVLPRGVGLRKFRAALVHWAAPLLLLVLDVRIQTRFKAAPPWSSSGMRPGMTVSNHISYLDVLVIASQVSTVFVTSTEVRDQPVVGTICRLAGCIFVDRRSARRLRSEIAEVAHLMRHGLHVVVFPEATSTRGDEIRPFRRALFEAARASGMPLWVGRIRYPEGVRMRVSYAGQDSFLPHLRRLILTHRLEAEWSWLGGISAADLSSKTAAEIAAWAQGLVQSDFFRVDSRLFPAETGASSPLMSSFSTV